MDILTIYAITAGGIFISFFLLSLIRILISREEWAGAAVFVSRHFTYPYLINRHQLLGPWTRASVLVHISYATVNVFLIFFRVTSLASAGRRAGTLSLINLIFVLAASHLSHLADLLWVSLRNCRRMHRAIGWTVAIIITFHIVVAALSESADSPRDKNHPFTIIVRQKCNALLML